MISIRNAMTDLEKCDQWRLLTLDCYTAGIKNVAQYAVDLDDELTEPHRKHLRALADGLGQGTAEILEESRATLRGLLRDYRDKASRFLNELRGELSNTANALQEIFNALNQSDGDHEGRLRQALKALRRVAGSNDIEIMRTTMLNSTDNIEKSLEEMRKQHQLTVSQFLVEIRALHKRIDTLESAASLDAMAKLLNREALELRIREANAGASLLLVSARGIRRAEEEYSPETGLELAGAFAKRLRNCLTPTAVLGRWDAESFVAIGPPQKAEAATAAQWITSHLSGVYSCLHAGKAVHPSVTVAVLVVERPPGNESEAALLQVRDALKG